jgi:SAM-dependent methyltransferase
VTTPARYDAVADFYEVGFPDTYDDSATAGLLDVTGPVAGLDVLDLACGHGRISRELARRGGRVLGLDISGRLIGRAEAIERADPLGVPVDRRRRPLDATRSGRREPPHALHLSRQPDPPPPRTGSPQRTSTPPDWAQSAPEAARHPVFAVAGCRPRSDRTSAAPPQPALPAAGP